MRRVTCDPIAHYRITLLLLRKKDGHWTHVYTVYCEICTKLQNFSVFIHSTPCYQARIEDSIATKGHQYYIAESIMVVTSHNSSSKSDENMVELKPACRHWWWIFYWGWKPALQGGKQVRMMEAKPGIKLAGHTKRYKVETFCWGSLRLHLPTRQYEWKNWRTRKSRRDWWVEIWEEEIQ